MHRVPETGDSARIEVHNRHLHKVVGKAEFFLKGYSIDKSIEFTFDKYSINIKLDEEKVDKLEKLKDELRQTSETSILTIIGSSGEAEMRSIAIDIKNLLSIALGRRVIFDRQKFWSVGNFNLVEIPMSKNENSGEQIIPDFELNVFLNKVLPHWTKLTKKEKDDIFTITDYLNQTKRDFMEDRILRTVQAWECSGFCWTKETELSDDLKQLKELIKQTFTKWKDDNNIIDKDGELGTRLTSSLDQEKLMLRLEKLVKQSRLLTEKINLDLRYLKKLRDQVAHTGRIEITGGKAVKYLLPGIKGLQLILLKRLGYDGKINSEKDGWYIVDDIKNYFE